MMEFGLYITGLLATMATTYAVTGNPETGGDIWMDLLYSIISALAYSLVTIGIRALTSYLQKKRLLSDDDKKEIDNKSSDLIDDGKLSESSKKEDK